MINSEAQNWLRPKGVDVLGSNLGHQMAFQRNGQVHPLCRKVPWSPALSGHISPVLILLACLESVSESEAESLFLGFWARPMSSDELLVCGLCLCSRGLFEVSVFPSWFENPFPYCGCFPHDSLAFWLIFCYLNCFSHMVKVNPFIMGIDFISCVCVCVCEGLLSCS